MNLEDEEFITVSLSPSYFWSCFTLSDDCPFFTTLDPKLCYFGFGIAALYGVFLFIVISDLGFYWALDKMQKQIDYYINLVTSKVKRVQMDQRKLITTKERTDRQLKKCRDRTRILTGLRSALSTGEPQNNVLDIAAVLEETSTSDEIAWSNIKNFVEF